MSIIYLDTAALAKRVITERETAALGKFLQQHRTATRVSSELAITELHRAARRVDEETSKRATEVLRGIHLRRITRKLLEDAALLDPPTLRSLGAIHLATALEFADDIEALVTYDHRLAETARSHRLHVETPA